MPTFGSFVYGEGVYGSGGSLASKFLTNNTIYVVFESEIVVDSHFFDLSNYQLVPLNGSAPLNIKGIVAFGDNRQTTQVMRLQTDFAKEGDSYRLIISGLFVRDGSGLATYGDLTYTSTKISNILGSLPSHYNTTPGSMIGTVLTAIGMSDHEIGGSN